MRLSKIRLSGFKSFVDATTILFPSNLTGIVGPNGCGKSNVIDAIRWVLGEASAKTLRGDSMADVIFNGSAGRKPVGQASVELVFDNADGTITGPYAGYAEVSVRRVVARDGTSLYFLNNGRCRRKDITHILLGTGLGSHGYSIIEQGMISRLVEAKPEELRAFIEEAAGISKYKERRKETEHRIRHTRENLERLKDLREEIDKQISHLQRQAKAAEKYKELKADERRVEAEVLVLRLRELRAEVETHESALKEKQRSLDEAVTRQGTIETEIEKHRVAMAERHDGFNTVQGNYYRVGAEIARLEQGIQHRKSLMQRQRADLEETSQQLAEVSGHIASDQVEIEQLEALLEELNPNLEQTHRRLREAERVLEDTEKRMELARSSAERNVQEIATTERTIQVENTRIEQLAAQLERLQRGYREQVSERDAMSFKGLESEIGKLAAIEETLRGETDNATRTLESIWERMQELRIEESAASAVWAELEAWVVWVEWVEWVELVESVVLAVSAESVDRAVLVASAALAVSAALESPEAEAEPASPSPRPTTSTTSRATAIASPRATSSAAPGCRRPTGSRKARTTSTAAVTAACTGRTRTAAGRRAAATASGTIRGARRA